MTEEGNAPASIETPAAPVALADENGVLRENWLESVDEDLRGELYLKEAKDVQSLARSTVHARRMVGKDKMVIPTEESGDEVWDEYHRIGGRPDTPLDYGFNRPDDFPEEHWDEEFMLKAQEILHKGGASKKLADALMTLNIESAKATLEKQRQADEFELDKLNNELDTDWGLARPQKMHLGNIAVAEAVKDKNGVVNEEFKARLLEKINKDPDLIRMTSNLGAKFSEHGVIHDTGISTPMDLQNQIDEIMHRPGYTSKDKTVRKPLVAQVMALREQMTKNVKTG